MQNHSFREFFNSRTKKKLDFFKKLREFKKFNSKTVNFKKEIVYYIA
jgi:hypothetical protein